jgi:hypothetical protein
MLLVLAVTLLSITTAQSNKSVRGKYHEDVKQVDVHFNTRPFLQQKY